MSNQRVIFSIGTKVVQYTGIDDNCDKNYARGDYKKNCDDIQTAAGIKLCVVYFTLWMGMGSAIHTVKKLIYKIAEKVLATHYTGYYPLIFTDISINSKGQSISSKMFTP